MMSLFTGHWSQVGSFVFEPSDRALVVNPHQQVHRSGCPASFVWSATSAVAIQLLTELAQITQLIQQYVSPPCSRALLSVHWILKSCEFESILSEQVLSCGREVLPRPDGSWDCVRGRSS